MNLVIIYQNNQKRVDGFKVINKTIEAGLEKNSSHYFFGSNEKVINAMINKLKDRYPGGFDEFRSDNRDEDDI